ncbi:unnamed protein product [Closterium sp. NIES-54]
MVHSKRGGLYLGERKAEPHEDLLGHMRLRQRNGASCPVPGDLQAKVALQLTKGPVVEAATGAAAKTAAVVAAAAEVATATVAATGLPESLAPLPRTPAPPCTPCVEGRQRTAPHSSSFPPTTAPFQTLHLDVWGPSAVLGPRQERYVLIVVDDYSRYTTVFPLRRKTDVPTVLEAWLLSRVAPVLHVLPRQVCRTSLRSRLPRIVQSLSCLGVREVQLRRVRVQGLQELVVSALGVQGFPPHSSLRPVAAEPGGVLAGDTGGLGGVGGGGTGSGGAGSRGTSTVAPTPRTARFLNHEQCLLRLEREERERFERAQQ